MPQEPKRRHSATRKRVRRASITLKAVGLAECPNCKEPMVPHQVCKSCGYFKGEKIVAKTKVEIVKA